MTTFKPETRTKDQKSFTNGDLLFAEGANTTFEAITEVKPCKNFKEGFSPRTLSDDVAAKDLLCGLAPIAFKKSEPENNEAEASSTENNNEAEASSTENNNEDTAENNEAEASSTENNNEDTAENNEAENEEDLKKSKDFDSLTQEAKEAEYERGLTEGKKAGLEEGKTLAQPEIHEQAFNEGFLSAKDELAKKYEGKEKILKNMIETLNQAANDSDSFFKPLKDLSMHIAQQLIRAELTLPNNSISKLVELHINKLKELGNEPIAIRVNNEDLELNKSFFKNLPPNITVRKAEELSKGDVEIVMGDTKIKDLLKDRELEISGQLCGDIPIKKNEEFTEPEKISNVLGDSDPSELESQDKDSAITDKEKENSTEKITNVESTHKT